MKKPTQTLRWQAMCRSRRRSVQFSIFAHHPSKDEASPELDDTPDPEERENGASRSRLETRPLNLDAIREHRKPR